VVLQVVTNISKKHIAAIFGDDPTPKTESAIERYNELI
jgi:hypothetical protein